MKTRLTNAQKELLEKEVRRFLLTELKNTEELTLRKSVLTKKFECTPFIMKSCLLRLHDQGRIVYESLSRQVLRVSLPVSKRTEKAEVKIEQAPKLGVIGGVDLDAMVSNMDNVTNIVDKLNKLVDERDAIIRNQAEIINSQASEIIELTQQLNTANISLDAIQTINEKLNNILTKIVPVSPENEITNIIKIDTKTNFAV